MTPLLFSCSSYRSFFLFFVIIFYFPNHSCIARKSLLMPHYSRLSANNKAAQEIGTDSSRVENGPRGIANLQKVKQIEAFHKEKNDNKGTISGVLHIIRMQAAQEIGTDSSRVENGPRGIANLQKVKQIEAFHKEKNDNKGTISGTEMISPSSLPHARFLKALKTKGARWSAAQDIAVTYQTGNKNLYRDIIEMDYDPPHRKSPIHN